MEWKEYPKINTLYKRDSNHKIIIRDYSDASTEYLKDVKWEATEKIDVTNICISWDGHERVIHGRTWNAQIPKHLEEKLNILFPITKLQKIFPIKLDVNGVEEPFEIHIYGEGYGERIQKGKNYIKNDVSFILFDVKINDWWLFREAIEDIAKEPEIDLVPMIGMFTIKEAEGLVLKTPVGLMDKRGKRIIVKIKTVDYRHLQ